MSDRSYLTWCNSNRIYPSFENQNFSPKTDTALASAGCIPVMWLPLFAKGDIQSHTFKVNNRNVHASAPLSKTSNAMKRFLERIEFLNEVYCDCGGFDHHSKLFIEHINSFEGDFVSIELQEIEALYEEGELIDAFEIMLDKFEYNDKSIRTEINFLSTVIDSRQFITIDQVREGEIEDMWNYFRIMGEGWLERAPWD